MAGILSWNNKAGHNGTMNLSAITTILIGKQTDLFKYDVVENIKDSHCFSIKGASIVLDLQARSEQIRNTWTSKLVELIPNVKTVVGNILLDGADFLQHQNDGSQEWKTAVFDTDTGIYAVCCCCF